MAVESGDRTATPSLGIRMGGLEDVASTDGDCVAVPSSRVRTGNVGLGYGCELPRGLPLGEFEDGGGGDGFGRGGRRSRGSPPCQARGQRVAADVAVTEGDCKAAPTSGTRTGGGKGLGSGEW